MEAVDRRFKKLKFADREWIKAQIASAFDERSGLQKLNENQRGLFNAMLRKNEESWFFFERDLKDGKSVNWKAKNGAVLDSVLALVKKHKGGA